MPKVPLLGEGWVSLLNSVFFHSFCLYSISDAIARSCAAQWEWAEPQAGQHPSWLHGDASQTGELV